MSGAPEWSRPLRLDEIGGVAREVALDSSTDERAALAARFGLLALERLEARLSVAREAAGIRVRGSLDASGAQACVLSGAPVPFMLAVPVALRFVEAAPGGDEVELSADDLDALPIDGGLLDLGEAAAQELALALDPYPRGDAPVDAAVAAVLLSEAEAKRLANPFGVLANR